VKRDLVVRSNYSPEDIQPMLGNELDVRTLSGTLLSGTLIEVRAMGLCLRQPYHKRCIWVPFHRIDHVLVPDR
jgi:hypothetical protein